MPVFTGALFISNTYNVISGSNPSVNKIRYYTHFIMVAVYLALGLLFLFTDIAIDMFPANRQPIGIIFLAYAIFRTVMTVIRLKRLKNENRTDGI